MRTPPLTRVVLVAFQAWLVLAICPSLGSAMTLQEARQLTLAADEANQRADYQRAAEIAKRVLDEFGDVTVRWWLPGSVAPDPTADIYDTEGWMQAQRVATARSKAFPRPGWDFGVGGTQAASQLKLAYHHLKAWDEYYAYLEKALTTYPAQYPEQVLRDFRDKPESFPRLLLGTHAAPGAPRAPSGPVWVLARRAAEALEVMIAWDGEARAATFSRDAHLLLVRPGDVAASLDGQPFPLEGAPYIHNDRLILPLSALTQAFHITVTPLEQASIHYWLPK